LQQLLKRLSTGGETIAAGVPEGYDALLLGEIARGAAGRRVLHIASDAGAMDRLAEALAFFHPEIDCLTLPAWDCLPYDRVSPNPMVVSQRMDTLTRLADAGNSTGGIVLTTVNAALQRLPARATLAGARFAIETGAPLDREALIGFLDRNGYNRAGTVMEPGEYAPRGGLIDLYPAGHALPVRIDLFGDEVESLRGFDPVSQRGGEPLAALVLRPTSEVPLDDRAINRFRAGYRELFGAMTADDPLYQSISAGHRHPGYEHWLALFHEHLETIFDYAAGAIVTLDSLVDEAVAARLAVIQDHYQARRATPPGEIGAIYRPLPPERLYLDDDAWRRGLEGGAVARFAPFDQPATDARPVVALGVRPARDFAPERARADGELYGAVGAYLEAARGGDDRVLVACLTRGARDRLAALLRDHGLGGVVSADDWAAARAAPAEAVVCVVLGVEHGFAGAGLLVLGEQDILGDRLARPPRRRRRDADLITEESALELGDLVVHEDHGIGRYDGLDTLTHEGAPHDCLRLIYAGDDKLYVPVENIEVLSRYGGGYGEVALDRLGGVHWQTRKARLKERIRALAGALLSVAAERSLRRGAVMTPPEGLYGEFRARFPFVETEDQQRAIGDVLDDLASGRPMDRLVCGDVGFGKTEVALRAAFIAVMAGRQVAVVTPTTLLCRQHVATFKARFAGFPIRVEQLSRLTTGKAAAATREGLANGQVDIVIGTHALLGKSVRFRDLGLLVIDEEQHFGVAHKERLKALRADVHVLTLTATPIPRTLQMALSGVRELSLIATPPVDRLAVRTFIMPYDPVVVREAILREHFRGGQTFVVCPRIEDIDGLAKRLARLVPEARLITAHGRMPTTVLENAMTAFYDGAHDVLISTAIIESGLDLPNVNTLIVHRAQMFGLAQLYQLRGRVGRSKVRAYAYLTLPPAGGLTAAATKRLEVMHKLDTLGAGFTLASHDLDIRGAGNLLGAEQSGHIREVGLELYQQMLAEAVRAARATQDGAAAADEAPARAAQINLGIAVQLPADYIADLDVRLGLYRRLAKLETGAEIDAFAVELADRFGPLPAAVEHLLRIVAIKRLCREAGIARLDAGDKGAVIAFQDRSFANPAGLVAYIGRDPVRIRLRPDHSLVVRRDWRDPEARLDGARRLIDDLAGIARAEAA